MELQKVQNNEDVFYNQMGSVLKKEFSEMVTTTVSLISENSSLLKNTGLVLTGLVSLRLLVGLIAVCDSVFLLPFLLETVGLVCSVKFILNNLLYKEDRQSLLKDLQATIDEIVG